MAMTPAEADRVVLSQYFRYYIPEAWRALKPAVPFAPNWHVDAMAEHLQAVADQQIKDLVISIAPRHLKSSVTSVLWPTWVWTRYPSVQFLCGAYGLNLSIRDAVASRRLLESAWYRERWHCTCGASPHDEDCIGWEFTTDQNVKSLYENDRGGRRLTASVEAGTTGEGGDVLLIDDPLDIQKAHSEVTRTSTINYFEDVWKGRRNDPKTSSMVVIAQRTHESDLTGHILREGGFHHLTLPTEYEPKTYVQCCALGKDPRTKAGELLHPERFGPNEVADAKRRPYTFAAQHQQNPTPAAGGVIKRDWIVFWIPPCTCHQKPHIKPNGHPICPADVPLDDEGLVVDGKGNRYRCRTVDIRGLEYLCQSWDTSFKDEAQTIRKGAEPDPVSGGVWGKSGPDAVLLDRVNERLDIVGSVAAVRKMSAKWPKAIAKLIEDKANGPAMMAILRREIQGLIPVTPRGNKLSRVMTAATTDDDKDARALAMVDLFHAGNVLVPHPSIAPWAWDYVEEIVAFPTAAHDDDVDMTSQALMHMQGKVWQEAEHDQQEARKHGNRPPAETTQDIVRYAREDALKEERKPKRNANPWRRRH